LRYQQGFLVVARPCGQCRGTGQIIPKPCTTCRGTGRTTKDRRVTVKIPAGIAEGQRLRLYGEGEHGANNGPSGDLYVVVHVKPHPIFHRENDDLFVEVPVPFATMVMGGSFTIEAPGGALKVDVPAGTASGSLLPFRGKGMPSVAGRGRGAIYVRTVVDVPKKLSKEQRKAVEQLGKAMPLDKVEPRSVDHDEHDKPFFERVKDLFGS
jgi:molecular chaperone DnaJ